MKKLISLILCLVVLAAFCLPSLADDTSLRMLIGYEETDPDTDPAALAVEEATGVHVEYEMLPHDNASGVVLKLMAILAAGDSDVYGVISMNYDTFAATVSSGAYLPLNSLLEREGQALLAGTDSSLWSSVTVDGDIMAIPFRLSTENYTSGLRVRTDLLKEAGVDKMPETLEELKEALTLVRDRLGIIPFAGHGAIVDEIAGAFGISNVWNETEDGIHGRPTTPGAREYVEYMHDLYEEGLLDIEWAQNSDNTCTEKFMSGNALAYRVYWWNEPSASETIRKNFPEASFAYLPPLKNAEGKSRMPMVRGPQQVVVIPRVSRKADAAMAWMNARVASKDTFRWLCIGEEGIHYRVIGENEYEPINPAFTDERGNANTYLTGTITDDYGIYWRQTRVRKNETLYREFLRMQDNIKGAEICFDPTSYMTPNKEFADLAPSVNSFVEENLLNMIVGTRPVSEWDDFVQEYLAYGGAELERMLNGSASEK